MQIINIYERKEYFNCLKLFIFYIFNIIFFSDFVYNKRILKIFIILFSILIMHYLFCIFIESEFDSVYLQSLQMQIGNKLTIITFDISCIYFCFIFSISRILLYL